MKSDVFQVVNKDILVTPGFSGFSQRPPKISDYGENLMTLPIYSIDNMDDSSLTGNNDFELCRAFLRRPLIFVDVPSLKNSPGNFLPMSRTVSYLLQGQCPFIPVLSTKTALIASIKQRSSYENFPYRVESTKFDFETRTVNSESRNVGEEKARELSNRSLLQLPDIIGFWNFITNELYTHDSYPYLQNVLEAIKQNEYYNYHLTLNLKPHCKMEIGLEQEWLFLENNQVIPATQVFLNVLKNQFGMEPHIYDNLLNHGRGLLNELFTGTHVGTDGRRIVAETRTQPYALSIRNAEFNRARINELYQEIAAVYQQIYKYGYEVLLGGGKDGESISAHFNFSGFRVTENLLKLWNIFIGKPLQDMEGGERPNRVNPNDRFTLNDEERHENPYGRINNRDVFNDAQMRRKTYVKDGREIEGFEWRVCPAVFLNRTFTRNIIETMWFLLVNDTKDFNTTLPLMRHWGYNFEEFIPAWEFMCMSQNLSLLRSPFDYNINERKHNIRKLIRILKTAKMEKVFTEEIDLRRVKENLLDYVHHPINIKIEFQKKRVMRVHPSYFRLAGILMDLYHITDVKLEKLPNESVYLSSFFIEGHRFTEKEIYKMCKIFCLVNGGNN